ncbi:MAG TPA: TonB-dependent receptor [Bacteroidales bacterium]|nr:TonB-dependent receptor [Bacteroidales bacterium]
MKRLSLIGALLIFGFFRLLAAADGPVEEMAGRFTISGNIRNAGTGEELLGATVLVKELSTGTSTNVYGFYSISLLPGRYTLVFSYVGYEPHTQTFDLRTSTTCNIELRPVSAMLGEVVIQGQRQGENLAKAEMSVVKMDVKTIRKIPALMGEVDILKAIQLLPGVQATSEGGSGFSVRGGNPDQNLIILDEATVHNASHLLGFFSVFNNDAIKDVNLYKGDIPAWAGGRLSSLLDVRMKDGNMKAVSGSGGIGTISSRLTLEGPLQKDVSSWVLSGRRTYADVFLRLSKNEEINENILYFYDFNGKMNFRISENDRLFVSGYYGKDVFRNPDFKMGWGNETMSMRWNHLFSKRLFSNVTVLRSAYRYNLGVPEGQANSFDWAARMVDHGIKADLGFYPDPNNTLRFGASTVYHRFEPGVARGLGEETIFSTFEVPHSFAIESGLYVSNEQKLGSRVVLKYGLRYSMFQNIGSGTVYNFDERFQVIDSSVYAQGRIYNTYAGFEPRAGMTYLLNEQSSLKLSYSRTRQYVHLASNSTGGTPLDIWFPSSPNVKPQVADQFALGYFRNLREGMIEASAEVYYKMVDHAIDFRDHAELLLNKELEGELRFGESRAYGLELLFRKNTGALTGWVGYTLSRSDRTIRGVNDGRTYRSPYDKPHDVSVVLSYELNPRLTFGANWVYATGNPVTFPTGRAVIGNKVVPIYSDRNTYRMPDYHRLDLSITLLGKAKPGRNFQGEWNLSVYNAYARKNAWAINFVQDEANPEITYAEKTYLFSIIPSLTYNFKF